METDPEKHRQSVALFRYGVIADLVHLPPGKSGLYRALRRIPGRVISRG